tara:strand:+ start:33 stop:209 length:177 start_codon:yes stop_codon:yes gene_type:complete
MEKTKKEIEIILIPRLAYWHLANKGPNQHTHHKDGNGSKSCNQIKFNIDGKYKYTECK